MAIRRKKMLSDLADQLLEVRVHRVEADDLPEKERKVARKMMDKGYKFIIRGGDGDPKYAKTMRLAVELAGEIGKGAKVSVLESDGDLDEVRFNLNELAQSIAQLREDDDDDDDDDEEDDDHHGECGCDCEHCKNCKKKKS
jgi:hypothetical protein